MMRCKGFTLIEISIVLAIIGLLTVSIIGGMSYVTSAKVTSAINLTQDISAAITAFKQQYHMLPGDMSITTEFPNILNLVCKSGGDNNGLIGDKAGALDQTESVCVAEILYQAGLSKVDRNGLVASFNTYYGPATVIAAIHSAAYNASFASSIIHVIELQNIPCDVAITIDSKIDDGNTATGKVQSSTACVSGSTAITVLDIAI